MWDSYLANSLSLLRQTWQILAIGFATAGLAFMVGWTSWRRSKAKERPAGPDPANPAKPGERRAASRRAGHAVTVDMHDPDDKESARHGYVLDRSVGGLCLMVSSAVPVGSIWKVRPNNAPRTTPPVRVEVKSCTAVDYEWKLGCQFEKTPSYAILLMFG